VRLGNQKVPAIIRSIMIAVTACIVGCVGGSPLPSVATTCRLLRDNPEGYASCARMVNMELGFRAEARQRILEEPISTYQFDPSLYSHHIESMPPAPPTGMLTIEPPHQPVPVSPPSPQFIPYDAVSSSMPGIGPSGYAQ
jgi:hypothetical protein